MMIECLMLWWGGFDVAARLIESLALMLRGNVAAGMLHPQRLWRSNANVNDARKCHGVEWGGMKPLLLIIMW